MKKRRNVLVICLYTKYNIFIIIFNLQIMFFSLITFQTQPPELWNEISQLTEALRIPEGSTTPDQDFYVKIFQYISYEVQHKILLLTANQSGNNLEHCRLILLLLKRFPQAIATHAVCYCFSLLIATN